MANKIAIVSFFGQYDHFLDDFSLNAYNQYQRQGTDVNVETLEFLKLLNALSKREDLYVMARQFAEMDFGNLRDLSPLKGTLTMDDICYYIVLSVLSSMPREEIQSTIMKNSSILTMLDSNTLT